MSFSPPPYAIASKLTLALQAALQAQELKKKKGGKGKGGASSAKKGESAEKSPAATEPAPAVDEKPAPEEDAVAEANPASEEAKDELSAISPTQSTAPQLAQQSKARSASFRRPSNSGPLSPGLFSPDGETAPDIYRKHVARIEELEKENKRLAKESVGAENRWKKAEDELASLREGDADASGGKLSGSAGEVEKLVSQGPTLLLVSLISFSEIVPSFAQQKLTLDLL